MGSLPNPDPVLAGSGTLSSPLPSLVATLPVTTLEGAPLDASSLRGKVVVITNVSSQCGYTAVNYEGLNQLQRELGGRGLQVVGVPCNQFGAQEPGSPQEIVSFVKTKFGKEFPLTAKCDVNGPNTHPLYVELKRATNTSDKDVKWNFSDKFIVARDGVSVKRFSKAFTPAKLRAEIEAALAAGGKTKL